MTHTRLGTALAALTAWNTAAQIHVFVDDDAPDGGNGLTWAGALNDLRDAVQLAEDLGEFRGEVRIAGGDYLGDLAEPLEIDRYGGVLSGIVLRGGFAGLAMPGASDTRCLSSFATTLRGFGNGGPIIEVNSAAVLTGERMLGPGPFGALSGANVRRSTTFDGIRFVGDQAISVTADPEAAVVVRDCEFIGGRSDSNGGAIRARLVSLLVERSTFTGCSAFNSGGAIKHSAGALLVRDAQFVGNTALIGGAVFADSDALRIEWTLFDSNVTNPPFRVGLGGALALSADEATVAFCDFINNDATLGGAAYVYESQDEPGLLVCNFQRNTARTGGAIYGVAGQEVIVQSSSFGSNSAAGDGGAINADELQLRDSALASNTSTHSGGAVRVRTAGSITRSHFEENEARDGGAVAGPAVIEDTDFVANVASNDGGALNGPLSVFECDFEGNASNGVGGAIASAGAVERSVFTGNSAMLRGGAIYDMAYGSELEITGNSAGFGGGGVRLSDSFELVQSRIVNNVLTSDINLNGEQIVIDGGDGVIDRCFVASPDPTGVETLTVRSFTRLLMLESFVGGRLFLDRGDAMIRGCTIVGQPGSGLPAMRSLGAFALVESTAISGDVPAALFEGPAVLLQSYVTGGLQGVAGDLPRLDILGQLVSGDPGFADPLGQDGVWSTWEDNDYSLRARSRLIDIGYGVGVGGGTDRRRDLAGNSRDEGDPGVPARFIGPRPIDIGAYEFQGTSCLPDMNDNGVLDPADFNAWIIAYNLGDRFADQNQDGVLTPADFNTWIINFNNGCD